MLTKADLIDGLTNANDGMTRREAELYIDQITDMIAADLAAHKDGGVIIRDFGRLYAAERKAGVGRNVRTGEPINIPAKRVVRFKAGHGLAARINGG